MEASFGRMPWVWLPRQTVARRYCRDHNWGYLLNLLPGKGSVGCLLGLVEIVPYPFYIKILTMHRILLYLSVHFQKKSEIIERLLLPAAGR
jgi:hypothetical protein